MFNILQYPFIQNAFLAGSVVAVAAGAVGLFPGGARADLCRACPLQHRLCRGGRGGAGRRPPGLRAAGLYRGAGLAISLLGKEIRERDIAIGVVMTFSLGLGILFLSLYHGYAEQAYSILFGTILGISRGGCAGQRRFSLALIAVLAVWPARCCSALSTRKWPRRAGCRCGWLGRLFLVLVALAVSMAVQVVGVLLIFALLVGPAATAIRLTLARAGHRVGSGAGVGLHLAGDPAGGEQHLAGELFHRHALLWRLPAGAPACRRRVERGRQTGHRNADLASSKRMKHRVASNWQKERTRMRMLDLLQHEFVQNAFLAGTIVAIICGLVGYFVVLRGQAFATEALSHIGFTGATGAALVGVSSLIGMFFLTLLSGLGMGALGRRLRGRDVEIGMVLSFVLGLGVLFLSLYTQNATRAVGVLFGSILSVSRQDALITLGAGLVVLAVLVSFPPAVSLRRSTPRWPRRAASRYRCFRFCSCCCWRSPSRWQCRWWACCWSLRCWWCRRRPPNT